jgi:hypothetical protein
VGGRVWRTWPDLPETVLAFVADAAQTSVADLVYALAEANVPAGFIVVERDFDDESVGRSGVLWHLRSAKETRMIPLANVIAAFRARYHTCEVEDHGGALLIHAGAAGAVGQFDQTNRG